ncbi:MAG: cysteine--tRNA ligase [Candidatus Doudnabacteria bacterium]|nr:cysteine--tRNA ligase [Candidatus Doudnabacteria bacterium]
MLKLYNTLSKKLEVIEKKNHINLYTCGPTVYNYAHIGNLRSYIMADLLYRALKYEGYKPRWVMNITDIDDKTIKGAIAKFGSAATVENLREFTKFYLDEFLKDLGEVNVSKDEITFIRVTDVMAQIQQFIMDLIDKGYAYKADDGSTYFSIEKYQKDFGDYGVLVGEKFIEGKKVGARVAVDEYEKENLSDFALWKSHSLNDANIFWDHPVLGKGRPGWHIECSVINKIGFKGEPTDIHTGGVDLIFPHHTNEIAQSQALIGKGNFVHHWFHSEHLLVDGKKMAKSAGNFFVLKDLKHPFAAWSLRYAFLQSHYRSQQNFTKDSLDASGNRIAGLINYMKEPHNSEFVADTKSLDEDLNVPKAISGSNEAFVFSELLGAKLPDLEEIPEEIDRLIKLRLAARNEKDFKKSDELRKQIEALGYELMDTPDGQKVRKKM